MSQVADYVIANASGATVRADINTTLLAVVSNNSGSSEPGTMYAFMLWVDTTTNLIKLRNAANSAWITLGVSITASNTVDVNGGSIDGTPIGASSASTGAFTTLAATGVSTFGGGTSISTAGVLTLEAGGSLTTASGNDLNVVYPDGRSLFIKEASTTHVTVDNAGNVGIGTTPAHQLDVRSSSTSADNFISIGNSDNTKFLGFYGGTSSNALPTIYADSTSTALRFAFADDTAFNGFSEKMRITPTGHFGIGTSTFTTNANITEAVVKSTVTDGVASYTLTTTDNALGACMRLTSYADANALIFGIQDSYDEDGSSPPTERLRILHGGGLTFNGDTAVANALDDYEEGTWTPLIVGTTGSAGTWALSASGAGNNYTKIGNRVYFHMSRYVTNKGSYTGKTKVTGLPFANNGSTTAITLSMFPDSDYPDTRMVVAQTSGTTDICFYDGPKADVQHDWSDLVTGYYLNISGTYLTDS